MPGMATEQSPLLADASADAAATIEPESLTSSTTTHGKSTLNHRVSAFDLTRGLICLLMAIDHTFFVSGKEHPTESYSVHPDRHHAYLSSTYQYMLRFVTHTCAPGFCILMGLGIVYFIESRITKAHWSTSKTARYVVIRGCLFMLVGYLSLLPFIKMFHSAYIVIDIIMTLGIDFILAGLLVLGIRAVEGPEKTHAVTAGLALFAIFTACLTVFLSQFKDVAVVQFLWLSNTDANTWFISRFPPFSWLPLVIYGIFYGRLTLVFPRRTAPLSFSLGIVFFILFLAVRVPGRWGNLTPVKPSWFRKGIREFFWTNKYCPDLAFITLFTAINHLFITIFAILPERFPACAIPKTKITFNTNRVLLDIGTSPFAFYFIHMYTLIAIGLFLRSVGWVWSPEKLGAGYTAPGLGNGWCYWLVYALLVGWMWFVCGAYGRFKSSKPTESVWRYF